jgi:nucleoside phosphorylase
LLSHLPKEPDSNILDVKRLTAILDIMVSRQWLSRRRSIIAKEAFEITEKGREEHAMRALRSNANYRPGDRPRIVVVTMREDENRAVLHRLSNRDFLKGKHRTYATGRVKHRSQEDYSIAVIKTVEQGPNKAQDATRDAIEDLDPSVIFLTGIAGAIPSSEFTLGDVIVATRLHDFSVGALLEGADPELTNQGGPMTKTVQDLLGLLPALDADLAGWETEASIHAHRPPVEIKADKFYGNESWRKKTLDSLTFHFVCKPRTHPRAFTGAVVSSTAVRLKCE